MCTSDTSPLMHLDAAMNIQNRSNTNIGCLRWSNIQRGPGSAHELYARSKLTLNLRGLILHWVNKRTERVQALVIRVTQVIRRHMGAPPGHPGLDTLVLTVTQWQTSPPSRIRRDATLIFLLPC